jgi:ABC-2 type transport system ATP-binding protein
VNDNVIISARNLGKSYRSHRLFSEASFDVLAGHSYGLIGPNGSGKSVLIKLLCGFERPTTGEVTINPLYLSKRRTFPERFGVTINGLGYLPGLSGPENLVRIARIRNEVGIDRVNEVLREVGLEPTAKRVRSYSTGMKQKLSLAQALMEYPEVLLLDEPFSGLDGSSVYRFKTILREFLESGKTLLFSSHHSVDTDDLCDHTLSIDNGRITETTRPSRPPELAG